MARCERQPVPNQDQALAAAVEWLRTPTEANREAAETAAGKAMLDNAAGCCACAAALAGVVSGSDFHADRLPDVAAMVAQAVGFAVSQRSDAGLPVSYLQVIEVGLELLSDRPLDLEPPRS